MTDTEHDLNLTPSLRWQANALCLWGLCARPACRRARLCRRDMQDCVGRYERLVPEDARDGVARMIYGKTHGMSFDALLDEWRGDILALGAWSEAVAASSMPEENGAAALANAHRSATARRIQLMRDVYDATRPVAPGHMRP